MRKKATESFFSTFGEGKTEEEEEVENSIKREMHFFEGGYTKKCAILFSVPLALLFSWMHFCLRCCIIFAVVHVNSLSGWGTHSLHILNINVVHSFMIYLCTRDAFREIMQFFIDQKKKRSLVFLCVHDRRTYETDAQKGRLQEGKRPKKWVTFPFHSTPILKTFANEKCKWRLRRR